MDLRPLHLVAFAVGTTLFLLVIFDLAQRILAPAKTREATETGHWAASMLRVGQVLSVFLIAASAVKNCVTGQSITHDVLWVSAFGVTALALVMVTGQLGIRMLLAARLPAEIERGNVAAGLSAGAHYVATGIITSRVIAGTDLRSLGLSLAFFALGQVTLHVTVSLFRALTTYDDAEQVQGENLAAALSYAGVTIAVAIVIGRALEGDFEGWSMALRGYGGVLLAVLALYPVRQIFVQGLLLRAPLTLRGGKIDQGIAVDRSVGIAAIEAVAYVATALSIARLA